MIVTVRLPDNDLGEVKFVNTLSISVFECQYFLVGWKMSGKKEFNATECKIFIGWIVAIIIH